MDFRNSHSRGLSQRPRLDIWPQSRHFGGSEWSSSSPARDPSTPIFAQFLPSLLVPRCSSLDVGPPLFVPCCWFFVLRPRPSSPLFVPRPSAGAPRIAGRPRGESLGGAMSQATRGSPHPTPPRPCHRHAQAHLHTYFQLCVRGELPVLLAVPLNFTTTPVVQNPGDPPEGQLLPRVGRVESLARKHELPNASANPQCQILG